MKGLKCLREPLDEKLLLRNVAGTRVPRGQEHTWARKCATSVHESTDTCPRNRPLPLAYRRRARRACGCQERVGPPQGSRKSGSGKPLKPVVQVEPQLHSPAPALRITASSTSLVHKRISPTTDAWSTANGVRFIRLHRRRSPSQKPSARVEDERAEPFHQTQFAPQRRGCSANR
jgi:hypothetical protein